MIYDLQIVCVGIPPIQCKQIPSSMMNEWIRKVESGEWLEIEPAKGVRLRINPANVVLFDKRPTEFTEADAANSARPIIVPN